MNGYLAALTVAALLAGDPATGTRMNTMNPADAPDLSGTWVLDRKASDDPKKALEKATSSMRRRARRAVQERLGTALEPADTVRIAMRGDTVALTSSGRMRLTTVPGGAGRSFEGENGRSAQTASAWNGDALVVRTESEQFRREVRYTLDDGERLRVAITMTAARLSQPISYALVYRRVAGTGS